MFLIKRIASFLIRYYDGDKDWVRSKRNDKSMTEGKPLPLILQFAVPLLIGNLLQQTYNIIDAAIVGRVLGAGALASVGASSSVQFLVLGFCIGICAGFGIPIAKSFGAGDYKEMRRIFFMRWY